MTKHQTHSSVVGRCLEVRVQSVTLRPLSFVLFSFLDFGFWKLFWSWKLEDDYVLGFIVILTSCFVAGREVFICDWFLVLFSSKIQDPRYKRTSTRRGSLV